MTFSSEMSLGNVINLCLYLIALGAAYGNLKAGQNTLTESHEALRKEIHDVRRMLGLTDGSAGRFMPREEIALLHENSEREHLRIKTDMERLEERMRSVESLVRSAFQKRPQAD